MQENQTCNRHALAALPAQRTADFTSSVVDCSGADSATFVVITGALTTLSGSAYFDLRLQHGNLADGSDMADCSLHDHVIDGVPGWDASAALPRLNSTTSATRVFTRLGYVPRDQRKRYVRLRGVKTGTVDAVIGAVVHLSHLSKCP